MHSKRLGRGERRNMARELLRTSKAPWPVAWDTCKGDAGREDARKAALAREGAVIKRRSEAQTRKGDPIPIEMLSAEASR